MIPALYPTSLFLPFPLFTGALARDICFVRLAPSLYALRNLKVLREQAKKMVAEFEGTEDKPIVQAKEEEGKEEEEKENKVETAATIEKEPVEDPLK